MSLYIYFILDYDQLHGILKVLHDNTEDVAELHSETQEKVNALREEWFGDAAIAFFNIMDNHLLPRLRHVEEALIATQDRIKQVMGTIDEADHETKIYFLPEALAPNHFANLLFTDTLGPPMDVGPAAGLVGAGSAVGLAGGVLKGLTGGTQPTDGSGTTPPPPADAGTQPDQNIDTAAAQAATPPAPSGGPTGGGGGSASSGQPEKVPGFEEMGANLKIGPAYSAQVGAAGPGVGGLPDAGVSSGGGRGASPAGSGGSSGGAGTSAAPTPDSGGAGLAGLGAGAAGAAAIGGAAKVIKDDEKK